MQTENILCIISILLKLRYVLWPRMWSILVNINMSLRKIWILLLFNRIFYRCQLDQVYCCSGYANLCWIDLSTDRGMLMSQIVIVNMSISLFSFIIFFHLYFDALLGTSIFKIFMSFEDWPFCHYAMPFFISDNLPSEYALCEVNVVPPAFFGLLLVYLSPFLYFLLTCSIYM